MTSLPSVRLTSRAGLSPVRTRPARGHALAAGASTATPAPAVLRIEPAPFVAPPGQRWPDWHRSPLDRLQPVLTRFRD